MITRLYNRRILLFDTVNLPCIGCDRKELKIMFNSLAFYFYFLFFLIHFIIPFMKFGPPYLGKSTAAARAALLSPVLGLFVFA